MAGFQASTSAGDAPVVEEAMYDLVFTGIERKTLKSGEYLKDKVNGDPKLEWYFLVLDAEGNPLPFVNAEGEVLYEDGDPREVKLSKLTGVGFNIKSKTVPGEVRILKALLTTAEFKAFEGGAATPDSDVDKSEGGLIGRTVQGEVFTKENGWPAIGNIVAPRGGQKGK